MVSVPYFLYNISVKAFLGLLVNFLLVFSIAVCFFILDLYKQQNLVLPRTVLGNISLSGLNREKVYEKIKKELADFRQQPFLLAARGKAQSVTLQELGIFMNESLLMADIPFAHNLSNGKILLRSFAGQRVMPKIIVEKPELLRIIDEKFPDIPKTQNAFLKLEKGKFIVQEGQIGSVPELEPLLLAISQQIAFLEHSPIIITFQEIQPEISAADLELHKTSISASLQEKLLLFSDKQKWTVNFQKNPHWVRFDKKPYVVANEELPFVLSWDPVIFSTFLRQENILKNLEQAPDGIRIWRTEEGKIQFEGHGNAGRAIQKERLLMLINQAIAHGENEIEIPLTVIPPTIEVSQELQALGIRDLLAVGHTRFAGSPQNRIHNIGVGMRRYNGLLIPPGATFSFNENLGRVDETTGYKKELVIKPEGTIPEFGGGLCQVSSTLYRAALHAGLPIIERIPHSYAVQYYAQVGGHGLDATIYPPSRDLKFTNDTPGHILVQSYSEGIEAYFKFFGTSDERKLEFKGPFISNQRAAPPEPLFVPDAHLKPGQKKQVEKPHAGFDTLWYRTVTKSGQSVQEKIISRYQAVPAKYLVGGEITAEGENKGLLERTNPFE